jgi:endonuclease/exonuclease/phosphatase (EEP) superfamily protein YafD
VLRKLALSLVIVFGVLFSLLSLGSLFGSLYWLLDVFTHFNLYYLIALVILLLLALLLRPARIFPVLFALAFVVNLFILAPYFWPRSSKVTGGPLRVMSLNVLTDNQDYTRVVSYLREANADVIFLSEIEPALMAIFRQDLTDLYPHLYDEAMDGTHGLAFISRLPFAGTETVALDERHHRFLTAEISWQGRSVNLYGAHPHPPLSPFWTRSRDEELRVIRSYIGQEGNAHIFLGDLNASPWSYPLRQMTTQTRLRHAALGFGIYPTWRYKSMLVAAPLDHILVSDEWQVGSYFLGDDVGSDHFPVVAELYLPQ